MKVWTTAVSLCNEYLRVVREVLPNTRIIIGGPHVTGATWAALEHIESADYALAGEAERALPLLVKELLRGKPFRKSVLKKVPGLVLHDGESGYGVNPLDFPQDLDSLGRPAWDLLDFDRYRELEERLRQGGSALAELNWLHIQAVRGCPHHCMYCMNLNRKPRWHSREFVVEQLEFLKKEYGIRRFCFADDNLTVDRNYAAALFKDLRKLDMEWHASVGLDVRTLDSRLVRLMLDSGCTKISLGIESGSDRLLRKMGRTHRADEMLEIVEMLRRAGARDINALLMLGYPDENDHDVLKTVSMLRRIDVDEIWVNLFTPLPGIPITKRLEESGRIRRYDYSELSYESISMATEHIPVWRLELYYILYYLAFYSRPDKLKRLLEKNGIKGTLIKSLVLATHGLLFSKGAARNLFRDRRIEALEEKGTRS